MGLIVPAVLPSSRKDFEEKLALLAAIPGVSRIQIDVVDGKFAKPASWPYTAPAELFDRAERRDALPHLDRLEYEIDLMSHDAEHAAAVWLALGATRLTFHAEASTDAPRLLAYARRRYGHIVSFGLALNIATDLLHVERSLTDVDYVQFMGITKIGRQGQLFDHRVLDKIKLFKQRHPDIPVQVDGGVSLENARRLIMLSVSDLIVGSGIVRAADPAASFARFEALESPYGV